MTRRFRLIMVIALTAILIVGLMRVCRLTPGADIPSAIARKGRFVSNMHQLGELRAVQSTNITPDTWGKLAKLVPEGSIVQKDEPVAWMETDEAQRELDSKRVELGIAKSKLDRAREEAALSEKTNRYAVIEAESSLEYQRKQYLNSQSKRDKTKRLVDANLSPQKALEEAELDVLSQELQVNNADIALQKARDSEVSQREMKRADIESSLVDVEKAEAEFARAKDRLDKGIIRAPTNGIVLYNKIWKGGNQSAVQAGDQVGPWQPILQIPDLSALELLTLIDEIDIARISVGMPATIRLDAYPDLALNGTVNRVSNLARENEQPGMGESGNQASGRKVFEVVVGIENASPELRPGMTAEVDITVAAVEEAVSVPIESVFRDESGAYVYLAGLTGASKRVVKTGISNQHDMLIESGLVEGDEVYLADPFRLKTEAD